MAVPTSSELTLLRNQPHNVRLYLSVYQPKYVLTAAVNDATITKGERAITYDGASWAAGWDYTMLHNGITLLVGNAVGDETKGRVRVRSATSTVITVAENSHIDWADNDVLTVLNFYEINPVYPRIIQDPADETKTLWYKDYDIAYAGQNSALGSFICMGSHYAGFTGNVYYSATGTLNLKGEALNYHWLFEGGNPTGSSAETPGNIAYATPGHYTTTLVVSGTSAGSVDTSYRHISIYDKPGEGAGSHLPITSWELQDMSGSRDQGGYFANIRIRQNLAWSYLMSGEYKPIIREGDLVVIFSEDWYGSVKQSIGGNADHRQSIVFVGYILKGSLQYNYKDSYVDFTVGSPTEIMKMAEGFSISVEDNIDPETATSDPDIPSGWVALLNMDIKRAVYHYMKWHSTVMNCCDVRFYGTDRPLQFFDADRTSLYDAVNTLLSGAWLGKLTSDRQGALFCERDIFIEPTAYPKSFTLSDQDWLDDVIIDQSRQERTSFIEIGGVAYSGATGTYTPLLSNAPGVSPSYRGKTIRQQGLALLDQAELNRIAGALYDQNNSIYPNVDIKLAGNYRNYDIAPQEKVPMTVTASDTVRGISFFNKDFFVQRLQYQYNPNDETLMPLMSTAELCTGTVSDTLAIPVVPPTESQYGSFGVPPLLIPPLFLPDFPLTTGTSSGYGVSPDKWIPVEMYHSRATYVSGTSSGSISYGPGFYNIMDTLDSTVYISGYFNLSETIMERSAAIYPIILPQYGFAGDIYQYIAVRQSAIYDADTGVDVGLDVATVSQYDVVTVPDVDKTVRSTPLIVTLFPRSEWALTWKRLGLNASDTYDTRIDFVGFFIHFL
jgi:PKD repeat protein